MLSGGVFKFGTGWVINLGKVPRQCAGGPSPSGLTSTLPGDLEFYYF